MRGACRWQGGGTSQGAPPALQVHLCALSHTQTCSCCSRPVPAGTLQAPAGVQGRRAPLLHAVRACMRAHAGCAGVQGCRRSSLVQACRVCRPMQLLQLRCSEPRLWCRPRRFRLLQGRLGAVLGACFGAGGRVTPLACMPALPRCLNSLFCTQQLLQQRATGCLVIVGLCWLACTGQGARLPALAFGRIGFECMNS